MGNNSTTSNSTGANRQQGALWYQHDTLNTALRQRDQFFENLALSAAQRDLTTTTTSVIVSNNFKLVRCITHGCNGIIYEVKCIGTGHPVFFQDQSYVLKVPFNFGQETSTILKRNPFENEFLISSSIEEHPNINRYFCHFTDRLSKEYFVHFPQALKDLAFNVERNKFHPFVWIVFEHHKETLKTFLPSVPTPTPWSIVYKYSRDISAALAALFANQIVHFDVKTDNIVLSSDKERIILIDLGCALRFNSYLFEKDTGSLFYGNQQHIAPDILNGKAQFTANPRANAIMKCDKQPSFELGCILFELAMHQHPFGEYPTVCGPSGRIHYSFENQSSFPLQPPAFPSEFCSIVQGLLQFEPSKRTSLLTASKALQNMSPPAALEQVKFYTYISSPPEVGARAVHFTMKAMCHLQCDDGDITAGLSAVYEALKVEPFFSPALLLLMHLFLDRSKHTDLPGQLVLTSQEKDAINSILSGKPKFTPADISLLSCIYHKTTIPDMLLRLLLMKHIFKADILDDLNNLSRHLHEPSLLAAMLHSLRNSSFSVEIPSVIVPTTLNDHASGEVYVKVCVVNEEYAGKTALVGRFVTGKFFDTEATLGVAFSSKQVDIHGINCVLQIYDTAGHRRYRESNKIYAQHCSVLIFVYSTTSIAEFRAIPEVVEAYHTHCPGAQVILCGTKMDLKSQRQVEQQDGRDMATAIGASAWIETSAYTGENVDQLFHLAALCGLQVLKDKRDIGAPKSSKTS
ncbi:hypothetical protein Pelo_8721 [Pelomyxa schiedti]|nr:hypothetical protein Pelo_8721 [Pelomyxa schiedti]